MTTSLICDNTSDYTRFLRPQYSAADTATAIVREAWCRAITMTDELGLKVDYKFDVAAGVAGNAASMQPAPFSFTPNVIEPDVTIPQTAEAASVLQYQAWWTEINDMIRDQFRWFIDEYFPNECDYLGKAQLWICDTLTNGGTGMNPIVEDQIWQRDRARILKEQERAEAEAVAGFAAKGYPIPPGAVYAAVQRIRSEYQDKIAQASRDVAIKQAEIEIQNVRFAVEQAIKLYGEAINAAGDFIKGLIGSGGNLTQLIPSITDSQSKLISAASQYYGARINVEELKMKALMPYSEHTQEANKMNLDAQNKALRNKVDVAIEAAKALSMQVSAALNALHASAGVSGSGSKSDSTSKSLSHSTGSSNTWSFAGDAAQDMSPGWSPAVTDI